MKHPLVRRTALLIATLLCITVPAAALAAEVSAGFNKSAVQAGDTVELTVTVSGKGMSIAEGVFLYDSAVLTFTEASAGAGDGFLSMASAESGGADTLTARVVFTAAAAGEAQIDVDIERILDYEGNAASGAKTSAKLTVTAAPAEPEATPVPVDYSKDGVPAQNVSGAAAAMYVWKNIDNVTIPSRYTETELTYANQTVKGAAIADSNAPVLMYLSEADGSNAGYYVYDSAGDFFYPYQTASSVARSYILLKPDGSIPAPAGYTEATLVIDDKEYPAWKAQDAAGDVYLIYARNPNGDIGFYSYSPEDGAIYRYAVIQARPAQPLATPQPTPAASAEMETGEAAGAQDGVTLTNVELYILLGIIAALVVTVVLLIVSHAVEKKRRRERAARRRAEREAAARQQMQQ